MSDTLETINTQETITGATLLRVVGLSANAAKRVSELQRQQGDGELKLRLTVSGGGCSGFQYAFALERDIQDDDHVFEHDGAALVIDDMSLDLVAGSEVDFVEDLMGAAFQVVNPRARSRCGCGNSFSL